MSFYTNPIQGAASGERWMPSDQAHEYLYAQWIFTAHDHGIRFDYHLPTDRSAGPQIDEIGDRLRTLLMKLCVANSDAASHFPQDTLKQPGDKWYFYSGMQKAIRRSNYPLALKCAAALLNSGDGSAMWRRLAITMLEDLGLSSPYLAALVLTAASSKAFRQEVGERPLLMTLLANMCAPSTPKSRDLNDVLYMDKHPFHSEAAMRIAKYTHDERLAVAASPIAPFAVRYAAYAALFAKGEDWTDCYQVHDHMGLPPLFSELTRLAYKVTGPAFATTIPFIYELMVASPTIGTWTDPYHDVENVMLNGMHSAAYDKHTYLGKAAAKRFYANCEPIKQTLDLFNVPASKHIGALERAIFYVEGAVLLPRLLYDAAKAIYSDVLETKLITDNGFSSLADGYEFYDVVRAHIGYLREERVSKK